jgi:hypothetical protein
MKPLFAVPRKPQVFSKKGSPPEDAVYVGRPSKWGNPFTHIPSGTLAKFVVSSRKEAIQKYREWLMDQPELVQAAKRELRGKDLVCHCAPKACHADVLLEVANS